jgi:AcrR family transcriptional regulator
MKKTKTPKHKKPGSGAAQKIIAATLKLIAANGWNGLTLEQIAKAAKLSLPDLKKAFTDKGQILAAIVQHVDDEVTATVAKNGGAATPHDRLFDVMMTRFDILQQHRQAFLNLIKDARRDPGLARVLLPAHRKAMERMLDLAGLQNDGMKQLLAVTGLGAIYALALCTWSKDDTADMPRTMAILDRSLRRISIITEFLFSKF